MVILSKANKMGKNETILSCSFSTFAETFLIIIALAFVAILALTESNLMSF